MKIYYLNDETSPVTIRLIGPVPEVANTFITLAPHEGKLFEIDAPERAIPYVKRWDNRTILLSYMVPPSTEST